MKKTNIPQGAAVMFVDPGIGGTGVALWRRWPRERVPERVHRFTEPEELPWDDRFQHLMDCWSEFFSNGGLGCVDRVVIEEPALWGRSAKSQASAISGDLLKLCYVVGGLMTVAQWWCPVLRLPVQKWKGQLPKRVVQARIRRALGAGCRDEYLQNHVSDAVGMGLAVMGLL